MDNKLSKPFNFLLSIGTPITGRLVIDAIMPGKCADPPAPAMITQYFFSAFFAKSYIRSGVRCAETILASNFTLSFFKVSAQYFIVGQSDLLPITIAILFIIFFFLTTNNFIIIQQDLLALLFLFSFLFQFSLIFF